jgi:hypothetical protein
VVRTSLRRREGFGGQSVASAAGRLAAVTKVASAAREVVGPTVASAAGGHFGRWVASAARRSCLDGRSYTQEGVSAPESVWRVQSEGAHNGKRGTAPETAYGCTGGEKL